MDEVPRQLVSEGGSTKSHRKELWFSVPGRSAFINITPQVDECLREGGIQEGLCLDNALNITPRISINDAADSGRLHNRTGQVS